MCGALPPTLKGPHNYDCYAAILLYCSTAMVLCCYAAMLLDAAMLLCCKIDGKITKNRGFGGSEGFPGAS